jgi:hypothetical protein
MLHEKLEFLMMCTKTVCQCLSGMLVTICRTAGCCIPEDSIFNKMSFFRNFHIPWRMKPCDIQIFKTCTFVSQWG